MSQSLKIFLSCAIGAFIGTLVALQLNNHFWWIGLLAGFAIGYLGYDLKSAVNMIPRAWQVAKEEVGAEMNSMREKVKRFFSDPHPFILWPAIIASACAGFILHRNPMPTNAPVAESVVFEIVVTAMLFLPALLVFGLFAALGAHTLKEGLRDAESWFHFDEEDKVVPLEYGRTLKWTAVGILIIALFLVRDLPMGILKLSRILLRLGACFAWTYFKLIHSDIRLLCGVDAAIGTCAGFFFQHAILGGVVGGLWGLINFEIVSKKILKCVPVKVFSD